MKTKFASKLFGLVALGVAAVSGTAFAADLPTFAQPTEAAVYAPSPWMIRVRALAVVPVAGASLDLNGRAVPGADVSITNSVIPELDISYFFTPNIAAELILGTTPHTVKGAGSLAGVPVGKAWLLPPTLLLQYHFNLTDKIKPYVGAGINYTFFYNQKADGPVVYSMDIKNQFGAALQVGVDIMIDNHWGINFDVKKLFLRPNVTLASSLGVITGKVDINPWIFGGGVTYRF